MLWKNFNILYSDAEVRKIFTTSSFVAYKSARHCKRFLVRSKVYQLERTISFSKFGYKRHFPQGIPMEGCTEGLRRMLGKTPMQNSDFNKVTFSLWLNSHFSVVVSLGVCYILLGNFSVGYTFGWMSLWETCH